MTGNDALEIVTSLFPLPYRALEADSDKDDFGGGTEYYVGGIMFWLAFGTSFLFAGFIVFPVKEKQERSKFLQIMSGLHVSVYWLGTFACDYVLFSIPCVFIVIIFYACGITELTNDFNGL